MSPAKYRAEDGLTFERVDVEDVVIVTYPSDMKCGGMIFDRVTWQHIVALMAPGPPQGATGDRVRASVRCHGGRFDTVICPGGASPRDA